MYIYNLDVVLMGLWLRGTSNVVMTFVCNEGVFVICRWFVCVFVCVCIERGYVYDIFDSHSLFVSRVDT